MREVHRYPLAISLWTETEFFSALAIKCRTQQITELQWQAVQQNFLLLKPDFVYLSVTDSDYHCASNLLKNWRTGLRAGDALHLAIANNHQALLLSLDERLVKAGKQLNIPVELLGSSL